jgi:hypothetical protein
MDELGARLNAAPTSAVRPRRRGTTTCRREILAAARRLRSAGAIDFSPEEIIRAMRQAGAPYLDSTIRTYIVQIMCVNAPFNHVARHPDLIRAGYGRYRLLESTPDRLSS